MSGGACGECGATSARGSAMEDAGEDGGLLFGVARAAFVEATSFMGLAAFLFARSN